MVYVMRPKNMKEFAISVGGYADLGVRKLAMGTAVQKLHITHLSRSSSEAIFSGSPRTPFTKFSEIIQEICEKGV